MAVDPNNGNNMIAVSSGYNNGNHVYRSTNAEIAATSSGNFTAIQGGVNALPRMPVYSCEIDYNDNDKVILGTEWGVWTSDNAFSAASGALVEWTDESGNGMTHVPVFSVVQQQMWTNMGAVNSGVVYLGTHGRGFYMASDLATGISENPEFLDVEDEGFISDLVVYPNPISANGTIEFDLNANNNVSFKIYNLSGSLVQTQNLGKRTKGHNKVRFNASSLSQGTYILSLDNGTDRKVAKFIVNR